jgi:ATP-dependent exoDNAse (exonuclease V) beta subunit
MVFSRENIAGMLSKAGEGKKNAVILEEEDIGEIAGVFSGSKQEYTPGHTSGFVSVREIDIDNRQDARDFIKEAALNLVSSLSSRFRYQDIAFLCRTNSEVELVTSWLLERHLPVESEKTLNIREHYLVKEIVSFLRFLNSPIDDLSFATFVMGEIFTSASGLPVESIREFLFQAHAGRDKEQGSYLYRAFRAKFPGIWDSYVEEFFKTVGFVPLYELAVTIIRTYGVLDRFAPAQGFIMKFLEVIKEQEDDYQNIDSFLEFFENELSESLYVHVSASDSINVVTIHKAKGLEFPAVIVPFFEMNIRVGGGQNRSRAFVVDSAKDDLRLINLKKNEYTGFSPALEARYRQEYKKALVDEFNSLYVACTRARDELYIYVPKKSGRSVNIAAGLIPDGPKEFGSISDGKYQYMERGCDLSPGTIGIPRYRDWIEFLKDEFISLKQVKERALIVRGEVMHAVLAEIEDISSGNIKEIVASACERAAFRYPLFSEWPAVVTAVKRLLESDQAKEIFAVPGADVYREKGLVDARGNARRVDRIVIRGGDMLIVDYKSSRPADSAEYRGQVQGYAAILRQIYPAVKIRGILLYLDDLSIEEVDCTGADG